MFSVATWFQGVKDENPPSEVVLREQRWNAADRLFKHGKQFSAHHQLGRRIYDCSSLTPCVSEACPECHYAGQYWFVEQMSRLMPPTERAGWKFVTLIWDEVTLWTCPTPKRMLRIQKRELRKACARAGVSRAIFMLDISVNAPISDRSTSYLQFHWHGFVLADEYASGSDALRETFTGIDAVHGLEFDGDPRTFAYMAKSPYRRRLWEAAVSPTQPADIHYDDLTSPQHADMMVLMDEVGFAGRLILVGYELKQNSKGTYRIRGCKNLEAVDA